MKRYSGLDDERDDVPVTQLGAGHSGEELTLASAWEAISGVGCTDQLLDWPPDVFALTNVLLDRTEAFRFALSPPAGAQWPPAGADDWSDSVVTAGREWSAWVEDPRDPVPAGLAEEWAIVLKHADVPLADLAAGRDWRVCQALLSLHAMADEACAGLGRATERAEGPGARYRARAREWLARTGSLARVAPRRVRVLPKVRTPPSGRTAFSRYACVQGAGLEASWHKMPVRHLGTDPRAEYVNLLLLPWPLRIRASDFRAVEGSVQWQERDPFGFFEFAPTERLDLDLVDRVLTAALDEVDDVDVVVLPEAAIDETEIEGLETVLSRHGVSYLTAGVRQRSPGPGQLPRNGVHIGVEPRLRKAAGPSDGPHRQWFHIRQDKHHRWALDANQIAQYHLAGALHPQVQWLETMDVPPRSLQFVSVGEEITIVSLVCQDLAETDEIADVIRSVGPTVVLAVLLDGPQLASRWAARYASVFADDPGSSVLTLTSYGMAQRSRPPGREASPIVALMKEADQEYREIPLEPGAQAVLLTASGSRATRRTVDGRRPVDTGTHYTGAAVHQIRAAEVGSNPTESVAPLPRVLDIDDVTILTGWAEAVAETLAHAPERIPALMADLRPGAAWRSGFGIPEPSAELAGALESLDRVMQEAGTPTYDGMLTAVRDSRAGEQPLDALVRTVLRSTLEQRRSRGQLRSR
ncbi:hypothetical protein ACFWUU_20685 [Kribbella sp. NPDC058693]|uniref:hypothetical protein n=1 Tax=Kribbella sp. NPDC058693 TaxID=3346602 RepID=UPI003647DBBB